MSESNPVNALLLTSPLPTVLLSPGVIAPPIDGTLISTPTFCRRLFGEGRCVAFYESLAKEPAGASYVCPHGFSVRTVDLGTQKIALTGLLVEGTHAGTRSKRLTQKFPASRIQKDVLETHATRLREAATRLDSADPNSKRTEALHEVRRLNQVVKVIMERACKIVDEGKAPPSRDIMRAWKASEQMSLHMDALDLLTNPTLYAQTPHKPFVFYQLVDKIYRIYQPWANERPVKIQLSGNSFAQIMADPKTFYIIPSTFIDNAIKYAPPDSKIEIRVFEGALNNRPSVGFDVVSIGPPATPSEEAAFFKRRGRGQAAVEQAQGSGVGLYLAGVIAQQHGAVVKATQRRLQPHESEWTFRFETVIR